MQNQEKIVAAIAEYLEKETEHDYVSEHECVKFGGSLNPAGVDHAGFCKEIAAEIAAAIAPHLEAGAGWDDAPGWAQWRTVDKTGQVTFWENQPHAHLNSKYWCDDNGGNRKYCEVDGWQYKIQQRPN